MILFIFFAEKELFKLKKRLLAASYVGPKGSDIRTLFRRLDTDHSGQLDVFEISRMVKRLLPDITQRQLRFLMKAIDCDGNGTVDEDELVAFITSADTTSTRDRHPQGRSQGRRSSSLEPQIRRKPIPVNTDIPNASTFATKIDRNVIASITYDVRSVLSKFISI